MSEKGEQKTRKIGGCWLYEVWMPSVLEKGLKEFGRITFYCETMRC